MTEQSAKLTWGEKTVDLPVKTGTIGPSVIDIGALYKNTSTFTYDPGFTSTASCESSITYIDGDEGILGRQVRRQGDRRGLVRHRLLAPRERVAAPCLGLGAEPDREILGKL